MIKPAPFEDIPDNYLAALDIGSNSFHFVYARITNNNLQILHKEKYRVKLADGLNDKNILDKEAILRGVTTLSRLASTTEKLNRNNFKVVATFTLRQARNAQDFLKEAAKVFPFDIEIISGHEEARLIYQGIAHYISPNEQRLVIDIGGGSTECIIGLDHQIKTLVSLNIGCVSFSQQYFQQTEINAAQFDNAIKAAKHEISSVVKRFKRLGWQQVIGTSGTIKSIYQLINTMNNAETKKAALSQPITLAQCIDLKLKLIDFASVDNIKLKGLKENRREVLCSGLAILIALFDTFNIEMIDFCQYALREGVLHQQLELMQGGRNKNKDIRQRTIESLTTRFSVDNEQANNIKHLTDTWYLSCHQQWGISEDIYANLLQWAAKIHEIGIDINPSSHHKHGRYVLTHADLAGFNQEQQQALAWLVGNHRKKIELDNHHWYLLNETSLIKICVLLRLAVLLNQQRQLSDTPTPTIMVNEQSLQLIFTKQWLLERPIVDSDLFYEQQLLKSVGICLAIKSI